MSPPRDAEAPPPEGWGAVLERVRALAGAGFGAVRRLLAGRRVEIATGIVLVGAGMLILAEFLDLYRVERGVVVIKEQTGGENHAYALLVAGVAAIGAALLARSTGAWPPAAAAAVLGLFALGIALIGDRPDTTSAGLTADRRLADADPAAGYWVELIGGILLTLGGAALALLLRRE
jgi:hypothetical protein